jgi:putative intracellular protease/amidase
MSPKGGPVTVDSMNFTDQGDRIFWNDQGVQAKLKNTLAPDKIALVDYMAVYFVGGHGAMWDFPDNEDVKKLAADMYEKGGIVGSVCHGAAALINVKLSTGEFLIKDKNLTGFTNSEEKEVKKDAVVPFLLETALIKNGAKFQAKPNWQANVQVADRLVTGQNPASSKGLGEQMVKLLDQIQAR